jgi:hypothetical protein
MSIVALKRKTAAKYNNNSAGHAQFSIVGTHRSQGFIGQSTQSRFLTRTLMRGDTARGHGGCCGSYPNMNITSSEICTLENSNVVKTSSKGNLGMLMSRYRWLRRPADESGASVKTVSSNRVSHSEFVSRQRQRAIKDALNSAEDCTVENYVCTDRSAKCKTTVKKPSHSKSYSEYLAERTRGCDIYDKPIINECMAEPLPVPSSGLCTPGSLDTIAEYLRNYMTEFRNSNFWAYAMDGDEDGHYIDDGGNDMYDDANFTTPWLLSGDLYNTGDDDIEDYPYCVPYSTITETVVDTDFHYVSLGWIPEEAVENDDAPDDPQIDQSRHPLTILGYRCSGPVGWQVGGNIGADGDGYALSGYVYNNVVINGFTVYAGQRQVYDADDGEDEDPTICHLIILLGHPSWGSFFDTVYLNANDDNTSSDGFYMYAGEASENILAIKTLLSIPGPDNENPIPTSELETVVQNFTLRIKQAMNL